MNTSERSKMTIAEFTAMADKVLADVAALQNKGDWDEADSLLAELDHNTDCFERGEL